MPAVNYRALVPGGFYSSTPLDKKSGPVSIRCNNPGAINGASWEKSYPGYVDTFETTPGNKSTIFEAPEYGVAAWFELLRRYAEAGIDTVGGIIKRYGGGQDYSKYASSVVKWSGLKATDVIDLNSDVRLLKLANAMFRYEAGKETPLSDEQILYGFAIGRNGGKLPSVQVDPPNHSSPQHDIVSRLIAIGSDKDRLLSAQREAARKLLKFDGEIYPADGCAITASVLLQQAGVQIPDIFQAIVLGDKLKAMGWKIVPVGQQQPGDIGSTCGPVAHHGVDHVYTVLRLVNGDEMVIADNQSPEPHFRWASGKGGKSPTKFFLRAPAQDDHLF